MKATRFAKIFCTMSMVALCTVGLAACSNGASTQSTATDVVSTGAVAATVNGVEVSEDVVTNAIESVRASMGLTDEASWGEWMATYGYTPESVRSEVLESYIQQELIVQGAEERGIVVDPEEVESYVSMMKAYYDTDEDWYAALAAAGMTEDDYRESIANSIMSSGLQASFASDEEPTEADLIEGAAMYVPYYDGMRRSSHILFSADDEATAQEVLDKINSGKLDFAEAAKEYSSDTSAENGGDVGWDYLNSFVTEYSTALSELDEGEVSGLVTSDYGIHIIKCTELFTAPEELTSLDQMPDALLEIVTSYVKSNLQSEAYYAWLDEYEQGADIVINDMPADAPYNLDIDKYVAAYEAAQAEAAAVAAEAEAAAATEADEAVDDAADKAATEDKAADTEEADEADDDKVADDDKTADDDKAAADKATDGDKAADDKDSAKKAA